MGKDIVYLPALYLNEEIVPYGEPLILKKDGTVRPLKADTGNRTDIILSATTRRKQEISTDGISKSYLSPGQTY
jgi:hypothetical protein